MHDQAAALLNIAKHLGMLVRKVEHSGANGGAIPIPIVGIEKSEGQWRRKFAAGGTVNSVRVPGIPVHGPAKPEVQSIEVGINRVFAALSSRQTVAQLRQRNMDHLPCLGERQVKTYP